MAGVMKALRVTEVWRDPDHPPTPSWLPHAKPLRLCFHSLSTSRSPFSLFCHFLPQSAFRNSFPIFWASPLTPGAITTFSSTPLGSTPVKCRDTRCHHMGRPGCGETASTVRRQPGSVQERKIRGTIVDLEGGS